MASPTFDIFRPVHFSHSSEGTVVICISLVT